jgi:hypothetical protein
VQDATLALDNAGLKIGALHDGFDEVIKPGHVIRQEPPAGMAVPADSPVTLVISRGPPLVEMPALVGKTLEEARRLLEERGLVITYLRRVGTDQAEPGLVLEQAPGAAARVRPGEVVITVTVSVRPGDEGAPPKAPVITAEPQPAPSPTGASTGQAVPTPRSAARPTVTPGSSAGARAGIEPIARPTPATSPGQVRRTRILVLVPEGGPQEVRIVVIDETGVRTVYHARHVPGDRIDQIVQSQGYTIIQVYLDNRLVQEVRP